MRLPPLFTAYCLLILLGFTAARYQGLTLLGSTGQAAAATTGGTRSGGSSGYHK